MILAADAERANGDAVKQAESVAECALEVQFCLRCYGKVPRTETKTEFAIALDTGPVATGLLPGNAPAYVINVQILNFPRYCMFGKVMENVRDLWQFAAPRHISMSSATCELLMASNKFDYEWNISHVS